MNLPLREPWTQEEFFAWAENQETRYEFDGVPPGAMTGCVNNAARGAMSARPSAAPVADALRGQRGLTCMLRYAAVCLEPEAAAAGLETLASRFAARGRVTGRDVALSGFLKSNLDPWFGPATDSHHCAPMHQHAAGKTDGAWSGSAGIADVPPLRQTGPLSRRRKSRSPWFAPAASPSQHSRSSGTGEDRRCPRPA